MNQKSSSSLPVFMPVIYLVLSLLYIRFVIDPVLHFHYLQPPFVFAGEFFKRFTNHPGGLSELLADFMLQAFHSRYMGAIVFIAVNAVIWLLTYLLLNAIHKSRMNRVWAFIPFTLIIALSNTFNFPFSVVISILFILIFLFLLSKTGKNPLGFLITYSIGSLLIYYASGSGYFLLFSISSLLFLPKSGVALKAGIIGIVAAFSVLIPHLASRFIYALTPAQEYLYFYPWKPYFLEYKPNVFFYILLASVPALLLLTSVYSIIVNKRKSGVITEYESAITSVGYVLVLILALYAHKMLFQSDAKKVVEADYYCYTNNSKKVARAATTLEKYSFAANLNYNLVMAKTGKFNEEFFGFFQIKGSDGLYPDVYFQSENSFISADFYYDLGYISEARHWAYESLVNFPYSLRAMQILVKIHLVNREYNAAEKYLNIMQKGVTGKEFVNKYLPYIKDTTLISADKELMEKRAFMPGEHELDPNIGNRFKELLEANPQNKRAYEYLVMFYLLNAELDKFVELYKQSGNYFEKPVPIYEEAVLMYRESETNSVFLETKISESTQKRYNSFKEKVSKYKGNMRAARNDLYPDYGNSYMYYLQLVYPILLKPEYIDNNEDGEPTI